MHQQRVDGGCFGPSRSINAPRNISWPFLHPKKANNSESIGAALRKGVNLTRNSTTPSIFSQADLTTRPESPKSQQNGAASSEGLNGDGKVVTTFRWPAALSPLDGKEVSVVGDPRCPYESLPISRITAGSNISLLVIAGVRAVL